MEQVSLDSAVVDATQQAYAHYLHNILASVIYANNLDGSLLIFKPGEGNNAYGSVYFDTYLLVRIKVGKRSSYWSMHKKYIDLLPSGTVTKTPPSDAEYTRIEIESPEDLQKYWEVMQQILQNVINAIPKSFDCCSRYMECSDALKCVNPDKRLALECGYRSILQSGRVFYGNNRNVIELNVSTLDT